MFIIACRHRHKRTKTAKGSRSKVLPLIALPADAPSYQQVNLVPAHFRLREGSCLRGCELPMPPTGEILK